MDGLKPRRTAGSRPFVEIFRMAWHTNGGLVPPSTDPELDLAAFDSGRPLVLRGWRKEGSRRRTGVLVLNGSGIGSVAWHRGSPRRYEPVGDLLSPPFELERIHDLGDASIWRSRPYLFELGLRAAGRPWTLWVNVWDLALLYAATGIGSQVEEAGENDG